MPKGTPDLDIFLHGARHGGMQRLQDLKTPSLLATVPAAACARTVAGEGSPGSSPVREKIPVSEEDAVAGATSCRHAAAAAKQQTGHIFRVRVHARSGTAAMPQAACLQGRMSRCHPYLPCRAHRRAGTGRVRWQAACLCRVPRRRRPLGAGARGAGAPPCAAASA